MFNDSDIKEENRLVLRRRHRILCEEAEVDLAPLGLTAECAAELKSLDPSQVERAADTCAPLFHFHLEDQIIRLLAETHVVPLGKKNPMDQEMQEDATLLLVNRWNSSRQSPWYAGIVLGMSRNLISALSRATYTDLRRVAACGIRARMAVRSQYIFHAGRNPVLQTSQRTGLAICNLRNNSF